MFNNINNTKYYKSKYNYIISNFFLKNKIKIKLDLLKNNMNFYNIKLYNTIKDLFTCYIQNNYEFYVVNVNLKFNVNFFIDSILKFYRSSKVLLEHTKYNLCIFKDKIFILPTNLNSFITLYKNKKLRENLIKKFSHYKINFILFSYENLYNIVNKINKEEMFNIIFIDGLQKFVIDNSKHYELIKFLNLKNIIDIDIPINNNFKYINNISKNIKKINLNTYNKPNIEEYLRSKLFNQDEAIKSILFSTNKLKIKKNDNIKPIGSWLLCGPSGSGKTELAKILTYSLFGSSDNLLKIDMSEYMESNSISKLIGSPPGYSEYGKDTILSKNFKYNSSFVVLFDEIEKADKNIFNLMLQLLDEGRITLSNGIVLKFNKSFIIFTSNIGYSNKLKGKIDKKDILNEINNFFKIEFLNRLDNIIIFNPVNFNCCNSVFNKFIKELSFKFLFNINFSDILKNDFVKYLHNVLYGSRPLKRYLENIFYKTNYYKIYYSSNKIYNINYINNFYKYYIFSKKFYPLIAYNKI